MRLFLDARFHPNRALSFLCGGTQIRFVSIFLPSFSLITSSPLLFILSHDVPLCRGYLLTPGFASSDSSFYSKLASSRTPFPRRVFSLSYAWRGALSLVELPPPSAPAPPPPSRGLTLGRRPFYFPFGLMRMAFPSDFFASRFGLSYSSSAQ